MIRRSIPGALAFLAVAALLAPSPATASLADTTVTSGVVPVFWRTRAEKTGYQQTSDYDETMRYVRQVEGASRWVKVVSYGKSGQGRDLPLVILSKDGLFTPELARASGKPIVLIQNGIHSGEIEGKDACLALLRDIAARRTLPNLLDSVTVLILPIFSVDAHERRGRFNRINQNGPDEMGWRSTPIGLNLNRDYLKVEAPEMRALIGNVYTKWWPDLLVDDHTTDGADYRYDLTYGFNHGAGVPRALDAWYTSAFEDRVLARCRELGHLTSPYVNFQKGNDPASGIAFGNSPPRFSNGYTQLQCRASILVETHMLKPYAVRVKATYDLLTALLEELRARPRALTSAVADAEREALARGKAVDPVQRTVVLTTKLGPKGEPFKYQGVATRWETSDITGGLVSHYAATPWDTTIALYRDVIPDLTVIQPAGYLVPQEWTAAIDRLALHGVAFRRFAKAWTDSAEFTRIVEWNAETALREGHHPTVVTKIERLRRRRAWRPGDVWVPCDQRSSAIAVQLFEAQAPDGLTYWNMFDTVLEQKEYGENYVVDPLARKMLADDPALAKEFAARLASDTTFAKSQAARSNFFFSRSPWGDPDLNVLPVARALKPPPASVLAP